jgi:alpha-L-fucosidase
MTMNDSWGYHRNDDNWKTPKMVIRNLITCAGTGGNYLMNIGPKPDGSIPAPSVKILSAVGDWLKRNGGTIYGAQPFAGKRMPWANFTRKGKTLYAHIHAWPGPGASIGGLKTKVKSVKIRATGRRVAFEQTRHRLILLDLPVKAPEKPVAVLEIECAGTPRRDNNFVRLTMPRGEV